MANVTFDHVINSYLYDAYHYSSSLEAKEKKAAAIKNLVIAKVVYEKWEEEKKGGACDIKVDMDVIHDVLRTIQRDDK